MTSSFSLEAVVSSHFRAWIVAFFNNDILIYSYSAMYLIYLYTILEELHFYPVRYTETTGIV